MIHYMVLYIYRYHYMYLGYGFIQLARANTIKTPMTTKIKHYHPLLLDDKKDTYQTQDTNSSSDQTSLFRGLRNHLISWLGLANDPSSASFRQSSSLLEQRRRCLSRSDGIHSFCDGILKGSTTPMMNLL